MVTQTSENGRPKCVKYWPEMDQPSWSLTPSYPDVTIETETEHEEKDGLIERTLILRNKTEVRRIKQIQFVDWPDHGVPHDPSHFLLFLEKFRNYKREIKVRDKIDIIQLLIFIKKMGLVRS
jgi:protein tyrosine phosphatase